MKSIITSLFVVLILFQVLHKTWIVVLYQYNKEFITNAFCEKKDIQDNDCKANCYLEKQAKDIDDWEGKIPQNLKNIFEIPLYISYFQLNNFIKIKYIQSPNHNTPVKIQLEYSFLKDIFQPPTIIKIV